VPAEADVVAAFLRRCRRTIAMDDRGIEEIGFMVIDIADRVCPYADWGSQGRAYSPT
jgi:hypothetical protein